MPPVGTTTPPVCANPERKVIALRILQLLLTLVYLSCIALTSSNTGRWSYASIEPAVALGATGGALTCLASVIYCIFYKDILQPSVDHGHLKRVLYLLFRIFIDVVISVLWLLAFLLSLFPKKLNFRNLFVTPPYKPWVTSVVVTFIEFALFAASGFMILVCYRMAPVASVSAPPVGTAANRGPGSVRSSISGTTTFTTEGNAVEPSSSINGIELAPRVHVGGMANQGSDVSNTGLPRSG